VRYLAELSKWIAQRRQREANCRSRQAQGDTHHTPSCMRDRLANEVCAAEALGRGGGGHAFVAWFRRVAREVDQVGEEVHSADAIGHRMVHLHGQRGSLTVRSVESFDEDELPKWSGAVEAGGRHVFERVEQRALGPAVCESYAPEMEVEIECRFDRPARRPDAHRR
jgi:hypothetical protein